jgi:hypothetical protein
MDIYIALGWYILPLIVTVATTVWLFVDSGSNSYSYDLAAPFFILLWLVANLFAWLIYAACAAIFNIF